MRPGTASMWRTPSVGLYGRSYLTSEARRTARPGALALGASGRTRRSAGLRSPAGASASSFGPNGDDRVRPILLKMDVARFRPPILSNKLPASAAGSRLRGATCRYRATGWMFVPCQFGATPFFNRIDPLPTFGRQSRLRTVP